MPVDRRQVEPGAAARGPDLDELRTVAHHERDAVAVGEPARPERPDELVGAIVELAEGAIAVW